MPKLADYYVQVIPSMKGVKNSLESQLSGAASSAGGSAGNIFGSAFSSGLSTVAVGAAKVTSAAIAAATTGVVALSASAVKSYSEFEQLVGGVETLFGTNGKTIQQYADEHNASIDEIRDKYESLTAAEETVLDNASEAFKTAGLSANDYLEQVTSTAAAMVSSLGGDTEEAARLADQAIIDMSDNANKMGTSIESIQNAYSGFAKGNFTMLDNLKLGYGGTREEMERLLEDAEALSGVEYDISSYADITEAIHEIQKEMGITGTTYEEASTTIQGSLNQLSASWSNLVTGLADENANLDDLIQDVINSLVGYVDESGTEVNGFLDNIIPVIETTLSSIGDLMVRMVPEILDILPTLINDTLPDVITAGTELIQGLITAMSDNIDTVKSVINQLIDAIITMLPDIISLGGEVVGTLATAILDNLDAILDAAGQILEMLLTGLSENAEKLSSGAVEIITMLAGFITDNIDLVLNSAIEIVNGLANGLIENLDVLLEAGLELLMAIVSAIPDFIIKLSDSLPEIIDAIVDYLTGEGCVDIIEAATEMFLGLVEALPDVLVALTDALVGIIDSVVQLMSGDGSSEILEAALVMFLEIVAAVPQILGALLGAIGELLVGVTNAINTYASNMKNAAVELWGKIKDALSEVAEEIVDSVKEKVQSWADAISDKVEDFKTIGQNLITGLWNGISDKAEWLYSKITGMGSTIVNKVKSLFGVASPSKVFAEIGGYLAEGLEVGWSNEIDNVQKEINSDLDFSASVSMSKDYDTKASDQELGTFIIHDYISLDGTNMQEKIATYTIQKIGNETRAVKVAQGGYYGI